MSIVKNTKARPADTYPARNLHELRMESDISSFIEYRVRTGYSLGTAQKRRQGKIAI